MSACADLTRIALVTEARNMRSKPNKPRHMPEHRGNSEGIVSTENDEAFTHFLWVANLEAICLSHGCFQHLVIYRGRTRKTVKSYHKANCYILCHFKAVGSVQKAISRCRFLDIDKKMAI